MDGQTSALAALITLTPIFELRGAIPFALARGMPVVGTYFLCVAVNAAIGPIVFLFLKTVHRLLIRIAAYSRLFDKIIERARGKVETKVGKYGYIGLALFVSIPLPITGAYTGAVGAWVLGLDPKRSYLAIAGGVLIAGVVVTLVSLLGIEALAVFVKEVG